ncbi:MAG: fructose-1,6-bisphosphatase [Chloroflexi bacterium]|nr:MAG: fructose-1,6-bisphosphatase [Chloroflexota bacterium]
MDLTYLQLLAEKFPSIQSASTEIVKLDAMLDLPKETEHFISDIHGEFEAFLHLLKSGSGSLRRRLNELFEYEISESERRTLATLIYYPERKLPLILQKVDDENDWYRRTLMQLVRLCRVLIYKYTRVQVRAALPKEYAELIEELLYPQAENPNAQDYCHNILNAIVAVGQSEKLIISIANFIQRLAIAHLHVIGDIYDRGPGAHIILDHLMEYHSLDIQWGNHDIVWMGAAAGSEACIANVIRMSLRYTNTETLENGYGISLLPLAVFAMEVYGDDSCQQFMPRNTDDMVQETAVADDEQRLLARMQKAITIIQLKLEGQIIQRRPHYQMEDRLLLDKIDCEIGKIAIDGKQYDLIDQNFPTINTENSYQLTKQEKSVVLRLQQSFISSQKLQQHVRFLYAKGGMYRVYNGNLLYHGCISFNEDGTFSELAIDDQLFSGKSYMDRVERLARQGYFETDPELRQYGQDATWYLWSGARSPLFGKDKMATFERYFVKDKSTHRERANPYYAMRDDTTAIDKILQEFGVNPKTGHIINGHVPVKVKKGQRPIKANGKLLVIDGGLAKAYQKVTGIAGYTLISNSRGLLLAEHKPFVSVQTAVREEQDVESSTEIIATYPRQNKVRDTDRGQDLQKRIEALQQLLEAYRAGFIKEE